MSINIENFTSGEVSKLIDSIRPEQIEIVRVEGNRKDVIFHLDKEGTAKAVELSGIANELKLSGVDNISEIIDLYTFYVGTSMNSRDNSVSMKVVLSYGKRAYAGEIYLSGNDIEALSKIVDDRIAEKNKDSKYTARRKENIKMNKYR